MLKKIISLIIAVSFLFVTGMASFGWAGSEQDLKGKVKPSDVPLSIK